MEMRLQKYLALCGVASRRASEKLILSGCVSVNAETANALGTKVETESDVVSVNGEKVFPESKKVYIMLNKPKGYVCTAKEQFNRPAVLDLLPDVRERVVPVGRLDYDTSGLLLLTNDGDLVHKLTHPKHNIEKVYMAKVTGEISASKIDELEKGVVIDEDYKTAPAKARIIRIDEGTSVVKIAIKEGKNRQVRKMFDAIGHKVVSLRRIATGKLTIGDLKQGEYRHLNDAEVKYLRDLK